MEVSALLCIHLFSSLSLFLLVVKSGTPQSGPEKILSNEKEKKEYSHILCSGTELRFAG